MDRGQRPLANVGVPVLKQESNDARKMNSAVAGYVPPTQEEIAAEAIKATVDLTGAQNGVATIAEVGGKVQVQYGFVDAPEGVVQPAHIQAGTCANPGDLKHLLDFPVDGVSAPDLDISLAALNAELPLVINVRKSLEELVTSVACGEIILP